MVKGTWLQLKNEVAGTEDEDACCHSSQSLTHGKRLTFIPGGGSLEMARTQGGTRCALREAYH